MSEFVWNLNCRKEDKLQQKAEGFVDSVQGLCRDLNDRLTAIYKDIITYTGNKTHENVTSYAPALFYFYLFFFSLLSLLVFSSSLSANCTLLSGTPEKSRYKDSHVRSEDIFAHIHSETGEYLIRIAEHITAIVPGKHIISGLIL